jgi:DNA (cytosine-5)-methyltransferase 1
MLNELALFAGAGGGILGGHLLGWRTVCAVECNPYAAAVLAARQNDATLAPFPIWDDVRTFDGRPWRGRVDVLSGGFPCQDISCAGNGAGITGARSGLWGHMARIIGEVGPHFVFVENSPLLTSRGLGVVLGDLASMGYDARWGVLGARDAGAPHRRDRFWLVGQLSDPDRAGLSDPGQSLRFPECGVSPRTGDDGGPLDVAHAAAKQPDHPRCGWWETEPDVGRVADGVANRVDRLACLGNGQVPAVVRLAWRRVGLMR